MTGLKRLKNSAVDQFTNLDIFLNRKSTRLNSSHANISYAVFCLKKKKKSSDDSSGTERSPEGAAGERDGRRVGHGLCRRELRPVTESVGRLVGDHAKVHQR